MIKTVEKLREAYEHLRVMEGIREEFLRHGYAVPEKADNRIREMKRDIREFTRRESDRVAISDSGIDGCVFRISCPEWVETEADAEEWFDSCERIGYRDRGWDCTGQAFTAWYHIGKLAGRMVCWHRVAYDV